MEPPTDTWQPLPKGLHGVVTCAYTPGAQTQALLGISVDDFSVLNRTSATAASEASHSTTTADTVLLKESRVSLEIGDTVHLLEECHGWFRGYVFPILSKSDDSSSSSGGRLGIFPATHIYSRALQSRKQSVDETSVISAVKLPDPIIETSDSLSDTDPSSPLSANEPLGGGGGRIRPPLLRTATCPIPHTNSLPSPDSSQIDFLPLNDGQPPRRTHTPRPTSYGPGFAIGGRRVAHPVPAAMHTTHDTAAGSAEPLVDEIAATLRDWGLMQKQYIELQEYDTFTRVQALFTKLFQGRKTLLSQSLGEEELTRLRRNLISLMEEGNAFQDLDLFVRHHEKGRLLSEKNTTIINIYRAHLMHAQKRSKGSDKLALASSLASSSHLDALSRAGMIEELPSSKFIHIFVELESCEAQLCLLGEYAELRFSLYSATDNRMMTEEFVVHVDSNGRLLPSAAPGMPKCRALFADLAFKDLSENTYLVCRVVRVGKMNISDKEPGSGKGDRPNFQNLSLSSMKSTLSGLEGSNGSLESLPGSMSGMAAHYRRPVGWAVTSLAELRAAHEASVEGVATKDTSMKIFVPMSESSAGTLFESIMNRTGGYESAPKGDTLNLSLRSFRGSLATVTARNSALLENAIMTPRNVVMDVVVPGDTRNALYLTLVSGEFSQMRKPSVRNVLVTVQVRTAQGDIVDNCIFHGAGERISGTYETVMYYHTTSPRWNETIRIDLRPELFDKAHVFFTFRHCSSADKSDAKKDKGEQNFAFAFLPLLRGNHTVITDANHALNLYKYERRITAPAVYLAYPAGANLLVHAKHSPSSADALATAADAMSKLPTLKDSFVIRTYLCSTKLTQNVSLHNLLHWRQGRQSVEHVLRDFTMIGEIEIIKFLPGILDALFSIIDNNTDKSLSKDVPNVEELVFTALVFTLGIVMDKRFVEHRATVDTYIATRLKSPRAWVVLLREFELLVKNPGDVGKGKELRSAIKIWSFLFRIAIRSNFISVHPPSTTSRRESQSQAEVAQESAETVLPPPPSPSASTPPGPTSDFIQSITSLFNAINHMMTLSSPGHIIGSQTLTLQHFSVLLPDLADVFPPTHLVTVAATFVDSVRSNRAKLNGYKLLFMKDLVRGFLFADERSRGVLVSCVSRWVGDWIRELLTQARLSAERASGSIAEEGENLRLCLDVIAEMVDRLQRVSERRDRGKHHEILTPVDGEDHVPPLAAAAAAPQHAAIVMCVADLLPKLLDMHIALSHEPELAKSVMPKPSKTDGSTTRSGTTPTSTTNGNSPLVPRFLELSYLDSIILSIVHLVGGTQIQSFLQKHCAENGPRGTVRILHALCEVFGSMITEDIYPSSWVSMNMIAHRTAIKVLRPLSALLSDEFLLAEEEDAARRGSTAFSVTGSDYSHMLDFASGTRGSQTAGTIPTTTVINGGDENQGLDLSGPQAVLHRVWDGFFRVLLQLLNSRWLQIERFGYQRARAAHKLGADVRGEGGEMLRTMWDYLGSTRRGKALQAGFIPALVGPFLQLTASPHPILRSAAVELLFNTIEPEFEQVGHFGRVEIECIERLHRLVTEERLGDDAYRTFIVDAFERRFTTRALLNHEPSSHNREFTVQGQAFLNSLNNFLELSLRIRDLPVGEQYYDVAVDNLIQMLRFLRTIGRRNIYIEYAHRLTTLHLEANDAVEAALSLKLHGDLLEWRADALVEPLPALNFPRWQSEFDRKEGIYLQCLDLLESGQSWERAIEICRELAMEYERHAYSYPDLANILRRQADLFSNIVNTSRCQAEYYRVGFYGRDCALALRNKQFIYRGGDWEKLGSFCDRLLRKYVGGKLVRSNAHPPPVEITEGEGVWLQVTGVKPVIDTRSWHMGHGSGAFGAIRWESPDVPDDPMDEVSRAAAGEDSEQMDLYLLEPDLNPYVKTQHSSGGSARVFGALEKADDRIRAYYEANEVNLFAFSRPLRKSLPTDSPLSQTDAAREFLELWTQKTVFCTRDRFPGLSRRFEVIKVETYDISPIENAVIAVRGKNRQLLELQKKFAPFAADLEETSSRPSAEIRSRAGFSSFLTSSQRSSSGTNIAAMANNNSDVPNVNLFTMAINGAVDAPVNGGIPMYKRAFLSSHYRADAEKSGREMLVDMLERAIEEQVEIIHRCLLIHDRVVPSQMRPLHEELTSFFNRNFSEDIQRLHLQPLRSSTSRPTDPRISTSNLGTNNSTALHPDPPNRMSSNTSQQSSSQQQQQQQQRMSYLGALQPQSSTPSSASSQARTGSSTLRHSLSNSSSTKGSSSYKRESVQQLLSAPAVSAPPLPAAPSPSTPQSSPSPSLTPTSGTPLRGNSAKRANRRKSDSSAQGRLSYNNDQDSSTGSTTTDASGSRKREKFTLSKLWDNRKP
ncbi:hypothetical protein DFS34DRAFT_623201 [Phlyctochytrium arcticum]|nr:hypothetical protein DFS34DRAFT_623201 [Phlyctochytrium arcticum]